MSHTLPKVYIIESDDAERAKLGELVESVRLPVSSYSSPSSFVREFSYNRPGCILLDMRLPEMSGLELQRQLREGGVDIPFVFLTAHATIELSVQAMKGGAFDVCVKPYDGQQLLEIIQQALAEGQRRYTAGQEAKLTSIMLENLTQREREVLKRLLDGLSSKEAARELNVSPRTLENHRSSILRKTGARNTVHLSRLVINALDTD